MIDWANHINAKRNRESEDARIAEMERHSAPFLWLLIVAVVAALVMFAMHYAELRADRQAMSDRLATAANQMTVPMGDSLMRCRMVPVIGEGI